jgi:hypothetical protein
MLVPSEEVPPDVITMQCRLRIEEILHQPEQSRQTYLIVRG